MNHLRICIIVMITLAVIGDAVLFADNAFYLPFNMNGTHYVNVKVDKLGGKHLVFAEWNGKCVHYGYCESDCHLPENWDMIQIFDGGLVSGSEPTKIQFELTPDNQPRVAFQINAYGYSTDSRGYFLSACDSDCLNASKWQTINFAQAGKNIVGNSRWFKLNHQGKPRAVTFYAETINDFQDKRVMLNYNTCESDCLDPSSWSSTPVAAWPNMGLLPSMYISMDITSTDKPRIALFIQASSIGSTGSSAAVYVECDGDCERSEAWSWVALPAQWDSQFDLTLDRQDHVRVAAYKAGTIDYQACDSQCLEPGQWQSNSIDGLAIGSGFYIHLIFDDLNRPHMAYTVGANGHSVDYLYCISGCDTPQTADWWVNTLEETSMLDPALLVDGCSYQYWNFDGPLSLALGQANQPIFGYSATNWQGDYCIPRSVDPVEYAQVGPVLHKGRIGHMEVPMRPIELHVELSGSGAGTVSGLGIDCPGDCSEVYMDSQTVTLIAIPEIGSVFAGWDGDDCAGDDICAFTIDSSMRMTALFAVDSDGDGLSDEIENDTCTDRLDADSDDDGIPDGLEDVDHNGVRDTEETDPCLMDSDDDGLQDGTEIGLTSDDVGPDTDTARFVADADPASTTDPLAPDTDSDGMPDGQEDANRNGRLDQGESDPTIPNEATEVCNGIDDDNDGSIDEGCQTYYQDTDSDGYGNADESVIETGQPAGYVTDNTDCDDGDDTIHPGAEELCGDGIDQDCNGSDEACPPTPTPTPTTTPTPIPDPNDVDDDGDGYTENQGDCNDAARGVFPGAEEICGDGIDQDCDGTDETCPPIPTPTPVPTPEPTPMPTPVPSPTPTPDPDDIDGDGDGFSPIQGDCNDTNPDIYPGAEDICGDGIDQDCDGDDTVCPTDSGSSSSGGGSGGGCFISSLL